MSREVRVTLDGVDLFLVADGLTTLLKAERRQLAKVAELVQEWGPDADWDLLDIEEVARFKAWQTERIERITELRERIKSDAQFTEMDEIASLRGDHE